MERGTAEEPFPELFTFKFNLTMARAAVAEHVLKTKTWAKSKEQ